MKCTKTHIYYAMKNCNGDADELKRYIINIVDHYQVKGFSRNLRIWIVNIIFWQKDMCSQGTSKMYIWEVGGCCDIIALIPRVSPLQLVIIKVMQATWSNPLALNSKNCTDDWKVVIFITSVLHRGIIPIAIRNLGVRKKDMYAAKNLLLLLRPLQHTGRL